MRLTIVWVIFSRALRLFCQNIELLQAGELEGLVIDNKEVRKLKHNIVFKYNKILLHCDSAIQYIEENKLNAFGKIKITKQDSLEIRGEVLRYDGVNKTLIISGSEVRLVEKGGLILTSQELNYSLSNNLLFYLNQGMLYHKNTVLTSKKGYYNTTTKVATFKGNVKVTGDNFLIETDSLLYYSKDKKVVFVGPTFITNNKGKLYTESGEYYLETELSKFYSRTSIIQDEYTILADNITYDKKLNYAKAKGNVEVISRADSFFVKGNQAIYSLKKGMVKIYDNVLLRILSGKDTFYVKSDTLLYENDSTQKRKYISIYPKVKFFQNDIRGICDSLVFNRIDSTLHWFKNPVLWVKKTQLKADSIKITTVNNKLGKMFLNKNAIVISEDSIKNHNQIKGKNIVIHFVNNKVHKAEVFGNGECIYFVTENDTVFIGMNRIICSNMVIHFKDIKFQSITFLQKPEARLVPEHEIQEPDKFLKGYEWRIHEMPQMDQIKNNL
jgi:lipopolysaccharide export system protein LptA